MAKSGEYWGKVVKKWRNVAKSWKKWWKVRKSWEKWRKVVESGEKCRKVGGKWGIVGNSEKVAESG